MSDFTPIPIELAIEYDYQMVVQRSLDGINWDPVYDGPQLSYQQLVDGLTADTYYSFRVKSYNAERESDWSTILSVRTKSDFPIPPFNFGSLIAHVTDLAITARAQMVSQPIRYIRTDGRQQDMFMTPFEIANEQYNFEEWTTYADLQIYVEIADFFFDSTGVFVQPKSGDKIIDNTGGVERVFEVNPSAGNPCWSWYGLGKRSIMIYTTRFRGKP